MYQAPAVLTWVSQKAEPEKNGFWGTIFFFSCGLTLEGKMEGQKQQSKKEGELQPGFMTELNTAMSDQVIDWWDFERPNEMCPRITCPGWARNKHLSIYLYIPCVLVSLGCHNKLPPAQKFILSQFGSLEVWNQVVGRAIFLLNALGENPFLPLTHF